MPRPRVPGPQLADAGLLVVHGVGAHERSTTLDAFVSPLIDRLAGERKFITSVASQLGDPSQPSGAFPALRLRHSDGQVDRSSEVLILEAGWNAAFVQAGRGRVSPWIFLHSPRMLIEISRFHAQSWVGGILRLLIAASFSGAGVSLYTSKNAVPAWLLVLCGGLITLALAISDVPGRQAEFWEDVKQRHVGDRVLTALALSAAVFTRLVFHLQSALELVVLYIGIVLFPLIVIALRLLASVPYLDKASVGLLSAVEAVFTTRGVADMYAIASDQVQAAEIHARVRNALLELEQNVQPGGTITVVGHSGGALLAWWLLSDPAITERTAPFRYRLLTVGAALNWAKRGFEGVATPLELPLIHHDQPTEAQTLWLNVWSSWDPVPHGPVKKEDFCGWTTWDDRKRGDRRPLDPSREVRNLGAPVPGEHGAYWQNQQEFVPLLWRAVTPNSEWAIAAAGRDGQLWSNFRMALLSALVRARLAILAVPVGGTVAILSGRHLIGPDSNQSALTRFLGAVVEKVITSAAGAEAVVNVRKVVDASPILAGTLTVAVLTLFAYTLADIYANFLWQPLAGRTKPLLDPSCGDCGPTSVFVTSVAAVVWVPGLIFLPAWLYEHDTHVGGVVVGVAVNVAIVASELALLVWKRNACCYRPVAPVLLALVPTLVLLPALLALFEVGWGLWIGIVIVNSIVGVAEICWLLGCLAELQPSKRLGRNLATFLGAVAVFELAFGRQRGMTQADATDLATVGE